MKSFYSLTILLFGADVSFSAFVPRKAQNHVADLRQQRQQRDLTTTTTTTTTTFASGQGFGKSSSGDDSRTARTYGDAARAPIRDMIDSEAAMSDFFGAREEWLPVFRTMAGVDAASCQATSYLGDRKDEISNEIDFDETSFPWRRLKAIPDKEEDRKVLDVVLQEMHKSLVEIPVNEEVKEDENDLHFLEEGRRMLAITRFHVLQGNVAGSGVENYDALFATCWSELMELSSTAERHTGSLIVLPEYDLSDLRRFADMNIVRPLEWLGVHEDFEIASMQRGSPAIRLLYKLNDMPEGPLDGEHEGESGDPAADG